MAQIKNNKHSFLDKEFFSRCEALCYFAIILLVVLTFWLGAKFFNELKILGRPSLDAPTISVSGEGKIFAKPDIGILSFSAKAEAADVAAAQKVSADLVNNAVKFLRNSGVAENDLKTAGYSISPLYDFPKGRREFLGYEVRQSFEVKIRDLNKTGAILAGLATLGITEIGQIRFEVDKIEDLRNQAREKAILDAKSKAEKLAAELSVRLGKIVNFGESGIFPQPRPFFAAESSALGRGGEVIPEVPAGENEITSSVSITFEIR